MDSGQQLTSLRMDGRHEEEEEDVEEEDSRPRMTCALLRSAPDSKQLHPLTETGDIWRLEGQWQPSFLSLDFHDASSHCPRSPSHLNRLRKHVETAHRVHRQHA